jgi:hypothetical protein
VATSLFASTPFERSRSFERRAMIATPRRLIRPKQVNLFGWAVILVAIGARVGWSAWVAHAHAEAATSPDTPSYIGPARALIDDGRFSLSPHDATPMFFRTPGYPAFLAAILWVTDSNGP